MHGAIELWPTSRQAATLDRPASPAALAVATSRATTSAADNRVAMESDLES